MKKKKLILDCDPGHDDAIAIALCGLSPEFELLGISVVAGNQTLMKTGNNALNVVEYLNLSVPVSLGMDRPLIKEQVVCEAIHGESGLDGMDFSPHQKKFVEKHAVLWLIDTLKQNEHVTILVTGPMSNIAMALRLEPSIQDHIDEIIFMGGSIGYGNVSPAAEFNIFTDPEAAYIVLHSGIPLKMVGLDVTRKVLVYPSIISRMERLMTKASHMFVLLMKVFNENQKKVFGLEGAPLHDPATVVALLDPNVITFQKMYMDIDISHGPSYGRTNCDITGYLKMPANIEVAIDINVDAYWNIIEKVLSLY